MILVELWRGGRETIMQRCPNPLDYSYAFPKGTYKHFDRQYPRNISTLPDTQPHFNIFLRNLYVERLMNECFDYLTFKTSV